MVKLSEKIIQFRPEEPFRKPEPGRRAANDNSASPSKRLITATPWAWVDPSTIPPRQWLYGRHFIRKYVSVTVSPGGVGKTAKAIVEALAMVTGRDLLGETVHERASVWLLNEDPQEELDRRVAAACKHYGIREKDVGGRLFVDSFRDKGFVSAHQTRDGVCIMADFRGGLAEEIKARSIDVMIVDPFVSSHNVTENDNMAIDLVIKDFWAPVIDQTNIAVELIHHSKKLGGNEVTAESARGAVSLIGAARSAIALNPMSQDEASKAGVENRHVHFRATDAKANMAPKSESSRWYKIESVDLMNATPGRPSDQVGVVTTWKWPDAMAGMTAADLLEVQKKVNAGAWKDSSQSGEWVGYAVADVLGLSVEDPKDKERIKAMLKAWKASGALKVEMREDAHRKNRPFVVVGEWAN
ncbi:AAA family ATPase [Ancylobacter sp. VNQ12]|uniref:AAA family ATPase n=1 Tax=Ancylobacter sp. VNQ12 TaxID=3400920 RepID=UPI003BFD8050